MESLPGFLACLFFRFAIVAQSYFTRLQYGGYVSVYPFFPRAVYYFIVLGKAWKARLVDAS